MLTPDLFEELLATYPAEKRELARQVYYRFAGGDSTQFFTQLFILLDVYAHYAERVPLAVMEANQNAHAGLVKVREEIGLLAQALDKRNLNIANHAQATDEVCQEAIAKCNETMARFESLLKNIGAQVDAEAIVAGVQTTLQTGIHRDIIAPFLLRSKELAEDVIPTLREIRETTAEASRLWPQRIWRTALLSNFTVALGFTLSATLAIYVKFKNHFEEKTSEKIIAAEQVINYNQQAFRELAIAGVSVRVARSEGPDGIDRGFALIVEGADTVEMRLIQNRQCGFVFFTSNRKEQQIQQLEQETEMRSNPKPAKPSDSKERRQ